MVAEIRRLRTLSPNLGKDKLAVLLKPWCQARGIACPSASTIGRIISRAPDKMRHAPCRIDRLGRPRPTRPRKPRKPKGVKTAALQCLAVDTVERVRDGMRRYILTCIDPASRFGLAVALPSKATGHTQAAPAAMLDLLPHKPKVLLSENEPQAKFQRSHNGSEFEAGFAQMLEDHGVARWYT